MTKNNILNLLQNKLGANFNANDYYDFIVKNCKQKERNKTEEHHILPKSLFPEYTNLQIHKWNSVHLSYSDHLIVHAMLATSSNFKMAEAFVFMCSTRNITLNDEFIQLYEQSKVDANIGRSICSKILWTDINYRNKNISSIKNAWNDNKRLIQSKLIKEKYTNPKNKLALKEALALSNLKESTKTNKTIAAIKTWENSEIRNKRKNSMKEYYSKPGVSEKISERIKNMYKNPKILESREKSREKTNRAKFSKKFHIISIQSNEIIDTFDYIPDACKKYNISGTSNINKCLRGERDTAHGYKWKYAS